MRSSLPKEARHLVHVLSVLADSETGEGWHGQATIARLMGCTDRHVRALLALLERDNPSEVRLERRARFNSAGRGRTSDSWALRLQLDQPEQDDMTNWNTVPPEPRSAGTPSTTNRNATTDQPEPCSGDLRSDLRSDRLRVADARAPAALELVPSPKTKQAARRVRAKAPKPEHPDHGRVVRAYFDGFKAKHDGTDPAFTAADGKAVNRLLDALKGNSDEAIRRIGNAFASWRGASVSIKAIAANPDAFIDAEQAKPTRAAERVPRQSNHGYDLDRYLQGGTGS